MSEKAKVLVREKIADGGIELLKERFDVDVDLEGDLAEKIGAYDAIIIRSATKLTADLIEKHMTPALFQATTRMVVPITNPISGSASGKPNQTPITPTSTPSEIAETHVPTVY